MLRRARSAEADPSAHPLQRRLEVHRARFASLAEGLPGDPVNLAAGDVEAGPEAMASLAVVLVEQAGGETPFGGPLLAELADRALPFDEADVALLFDLAQRARSDVAPDALRTATGAAERLASPRHPDLVGRYRRALGRIDQLETDPSVRTSLRTRLRGLLTPDPAGSTVSSIRDSDDWGLWARSHLTDAGARSAALEGLLGHLAATPADAVPPGAWLQRLAELLQEVPDAAEVVGHLLQGAIDCPRSLTWRVGPDNGGIVRGLVWAALAVDRPWLVPVLDGLLRDDVASRALVEAAIAATCYAALGRSRRPEALELLRRLQRRAPDRTAARRIGVAVDQAAGRAGVSPSELAETSVPSAGLGRGGRRVVRLGDTEATVSVEGDGNVAVRYGADVAVGARPPEGLARRYPGEVASLERTASEARRIVASERARLEGLLGGGRTWRLDRWHDLYLAHPITGPLASRLVWFVERGVDGTGGFTGIPDGAPGRFGGSDGEVVVLSPGASIRLWHPAAARRDDVRAWRRHLDEAGIEQPFDQVARRVFAPTAAERRGAGATGRFGASPLDGPVAHAALGNLGWDPGPAAAQGVARRVFADRDLAVVAHHRAAEGAGPRSWSIDQVCFVTLDTGTSPIPLVAVPPAVFSEALRDLDRVVRVSTRKPPRPLRADGAPWTS